MCAKPPKLPCFPKGGVGGGGAKKKDRQTERGTKDRGKSCQLAANETSSWGFPSPQRVSVYLGCLSVALLRKHTERMSLLWLLTYGCGAFALERWTGRNALLMVNVKPANRHTETASFCFSIFLQCSPPFTSLSQKCPQWNEGKGNTVAQHTLSIFSEWWAGRIYNNWKIICQENKQHSFLPRPLWSIYQKSVTKTWKWNKIFLKMCLWGLAWTRSRRFSVLVSRISVDLYAFVSATSGPMFITDLNTGDPTGI